MTILILSGILGFLLASLIALFLAPPLWRRAVRVTTKKLMQQSPRMIDEGQADRDQMRAEFAISTRKMEVKIERLKEASDTHLIDLSKAEKKTDRLQGKIESLQGGLEKSEKKLEGKSLEADKLLGELAGKNEQLTAQTERLTRQTELLNAQAATLEENTFELEARKLKITEYAAQESDFSAIISQLNLELEELRSLHKQHEISKETGDTAHELEYKRLNREIQNGLREISRLTRYLETRKLATTRLRQEASRNKEKISGLIRDNRTKNKDIKQLIYKLAATDTSADVNPEENGDKLPVAAVPASLTPAHDITTGHDHSGNGLEPPAESVQPARSATRRPVRIHRTTRNNPKPVQASETPSLADRIRALQAEHPKSM